MPRAIDDRRRRLVLGGDSHRDADDFVVLRMDELEQRMPRELVRRESQDAVRDRRGVGDAAVEPELGDEVGGVLRDELEAAHRLDQRVLALAQARRELIESAGERADVAAPAIGIAGERREALLVVRVATQVPGERDERTHQELREQPHRGDDADAGDQQKGDEAPDQLVDGCEGLVLRIDGGHDPVRRGNALVGDERLAAVGADALARALEAVEGAVEQRIGPRSERELREPRAVGMHDELAIGGDDEQVARLADRGLGDVAEHPGIGETETAGQDGDEAAVLAEYRGGQHEHHVAVADVGDERLRDHRPLRTDRVLDIGAERPVEAASIRTEGALGELDAPGIEQEGRAIDRGVQAGIAVQVALRGVARSDVRIVNVARALGERLLQTEELLVEVVRYALEQPVLVRDHHVGDLAAERIERRGSDREHRGQEQDRRRAGGPRRERRACGTLGPRLQVQFALQAVSARKKAVIEVRTSQQETCPKSALRRSERAVRQGSVGTAPRRTDRRPEL